MQVLCAGKRLLLKYTISVISNASVERTRGKNCTEKVILSMKNELVSMKMKVTTTLLQLSWWGCSN